MVDGIEFVVTAVPSASLEQPKPIKRTATAKITAISFANLIM
jgi:hypothetical protein